MYILHIGVLVEDSSFFSRVCKLLPFCLGSQSILAQSKQQSGKLKAQTLEPAGTVRVPGLAV